ncbi:TonB-dependent hemoglobin/transferrin/lactoferrin family receptor [Rhizobium puerariae]|uniref:TonB-dependent hemoglobin/transferrin/lactoferrin family receptor n=1 Tax=Rhizobium puerariae TaxID=1585791 RepID=A0ABV6AF51_9HYPH
MAFGAVRRNGNQQGQERAKYVLLWTTTAVAVLLGAQNAAAQSAPAGDARQTSGESAARDFDIRQQPLSSALSAFNRQSGIQITQASGGAAGNVTVNAVRGRLTPRQALAQMLNGTGIGYQFTSNRAAIIGVRQSVGNVPSGNEETTLDPIVLTGKTGRNANIGSGYQGTPDWVYEEPASVSVVSREAIQNRAARNANDVLDTVAGVNTNRSEAQNPGISVNVRGLQDQNRVTTTIDGARQDFQRAGHGASQRVYVDTSFIRAVEVEKGAVPGVGGAGSLGGAVNFRTVTADDIIRPGEKWGAELNAETGTNAYFFNGSVMGAVKLSDDFSVLAGLSRKRIGDYDIGKNGSVLLFDGSTTNVDGSMVFSGLETFGSLLKIEGSPSDDFTFDLSWLRNDTESKQGGLTGLGESDRLRGDEQDFLNNTVTSSFRWDPDSDLVDLKGRLWFNKITNDEIRDYEIRQAISYGMTSYGGSLENTSRFDTPLGALSLNYGAEAFTDDGETKTPPMINDDGTDWSYGFKGSNPSGRRSMASGFLNATLEHEDWLEIKGGLRYDYYNLKGHTLVSGIAPVYVVTPGVCGYEENGECFWWDVEPVYGGGENVQQRVDVDKSGGAFLPSLTVAVKPFEGFQPFVSYSESYRPPSVMETLISGGHPNLFPVENAPNPYLKPEKGRTWEAGANFSQDNLLSGGDSLRIKAVYFHRDIEDYISLGRTYFAPLERYYFTNVNLDGDTTMRGFELEASYDAGSYYIGASYTHLKTDFADTYTFSGPTDGPGSPLPGENPAVPSVLFVPPEDKFTLDAGVRFFDEKLVLGGRITHVGDAAPTVGQLAGNYRTEAYTVYDLYGSYSFSENAKLRFAVNNLTDEAYVPALGTFAYPAPGRTATIALNVKF